MCRMDNKMIDKSSDEMSWNRLHVMYFGLWIHPFIHANGERPWEGSQYIWVWGGRGDAAQPRSFVRGPIAPQEGYG
jgi:hypothetical protein